MQKFLFWCISLFAAFALFEGTGCYYDNREELHPELLVNNSCDTTGVMSFQTHILPILINSCGANNSCHSAQGASGGVILENYSGVKASVDSGRFLSSITWDGNASQMPKDSPSPLNDCSVAKIRKWIDAGALDN